MSNNSVLLHGDCLEVLKDIPDNSIDSMVTDPPAGISFMGKAWDDDKGGSKQWIAWMSEVMKECLRVLKPGAHGLVWAIPRTSHWTATAIEDAGFEIRDVVTHLFGSGFPKSMNISIAIDKQAGVMSPRGKAFVTAGAGERKDIQETAGWEKDPGHDAITQESKQWQGWGTALKPASEHWILCRKPCSEKTVAKNVLMHGTGGINIDASRVGPPQNTKTKFASNADAKHTMGKFETWNGEYQQQTQGRFPANLVLSHNEDCVEVCIPGCPVALLDEQSGNRPSTPFKSRGGSGNTYSQMTPQSGPEGYSDSGGASRFFYCAKTSKSERNANVDLNNHPTVKPQKLMSYLITMITPPNGIVLDPFLGSGSTGVAAINSGFDFIGIEKELEYFTIAEKRIEGAINGKVNNNQDSSSTGST